MLLDENLTLWRCFVL